MIALRLGPEVAVKERAVTTTTVEVKVTTTTGEQAASPALPPTPSSSPTSTAMTPASKTSRSLSSSISPVSATFVDHEVYEGALTSDWLLGSAHYDWSRVCCLCLRSDPTRSRASQFDADVHEPHVYVRLAACWDIPAYRDGFCIRIPTFAAGLRAGRISGSAPFVDDSNRTGFCPALGLHRLHSG